MNLLNFIVWLSTGAVIGWFANRMVTAEKRPTQKPSTGEDHSSEKG
jgi:hypothetical protein